jgi:exopolysaccharide production protein ExoZ
MNRLLALQGLRAIAAAMVVYAHAFSTYQEKVGPIQGGITGEGFGGLGVKIFFCISGFIIYTSSQSLRSGVDGMLLFVKKRLIRIAPIYWLATLVYAVKLAFQGMPATMGDLAKSLLFIPYTNGSGLMRPVLGVGWTLNFEMFFYMTLAVGLLWPRRLRYVFVSLVFVGLLALKESKTWHTPDGMAESAIYLLTNRWLLFFLLGLAMGWAARLPQLNAWRLDWRLSLSICVLLIAGLIAAMLGLRPEESHAQLAELLVCPLIILIAANTKSTHGGQAGGGLAGLVVKAGDGSYSTYLTHGFVMGPVARALAIVAPNSDTLVFSLSMVAACTLFGFMVYRHVEMPMIEGLNRRFT